MTTPMGEGPDRIAGVFRDVYRLVAELPEKMRGSVLSESLRSYLVVPQRRGVSFPLPPRAEHRITGRRRQFRKQRRQSSHLHELLRRWGAAEQAGPQFESVRIDEDEMKFRVDEIPT